MKIGSDERQWGMFVVSRIPFLIKCWRVRVPLRFRRRLAQYPHVDAFERIILLLSLHTDTVILNDRRLPVGLTLVGHAWLSLGQRPFPLRLSTHSRHQTPLQRNAKHSAANGVLQHTAVGQYGYYSTFISSASLKTVGQMIFLLTSFVQIVPIVRIT